MIGPADDPSAVPSAGTIGKGRSLSGRFSEYGSRIVVGCLTFFAKVYNNDAINQLKSCLATTTHDVPGSIDDVLEC